MNSSLRLTLIQTSLEWEDKRSNLVMFDRLVNSMSEPTDMIVLPEMFSTGFSMNPEKFASDMNGEEVKWMKDAAAKTNAAICGSLMIEEGGKYFNRFIWAGPDGSVFTYDKKHLFRMGDEPMHYTPGKDRIRIPYKGWHIFPLICYDLRFPVWLKRTRAFEYDLMLVVANWPERRNTHWKILNRARAIENQCYLAAVNRVGVDGAGVSHSGDSMLIDPRGEVLFHKEQESCIKTLVIQKEEVHTYRSGFPVWEDDDLFEWKE